MRRARCADRERLPDRAIELAEVLGVLVDVCCTTGAICAAGVLGAAGASTDTGAEAPSESALADRGEANRFIHLRWFEALFGLEGCGLGDGFDLCDGFGGLIFFS